MVVGTSKDFSEITMSGDAEGPNPSTTLPLLGRDGYVTEGWVSGLNFSFVITPFADWNYRDGDSLGGAASGSMSYDTISNVDVTVGFTGAQDDIVLIASALGELAVSPGGGSLPLLGVE